MNNVQRQRVLLLSITACLMVGALGLILFALKDNINLFYTPTQVLNGEVPRHKAIRVGGLVLKNSVHRHELDVDFTVSDLKHQLVIHYHGVLPDLFREGQGIVADGRLDGHGLFHATQVLAKHDENYMPPEVAASLKEPSRVR